MYSWYVDNFTFSSNNSSFIIMTIFNTGIIFLKFRYNLFIVFSNFYIEFAHNYIVSVLFLFLFFIHRSLPIIRGEGIPHSYIYIYIYIYRERERERERERLIEIDEQIQRCTTEKVYLFNWSILITLIFFLCYTENFLDLPHVIYDMWWINLHK